MLRSILSHPFNWQLGLLYLTTWFLLRLPYIGIHIKTLNTFYHEMGHAIVALLCNGEIYHIKMNMNSSGEALTTTRGWVPKVLVSLSGYLSPLIIGMAILFGVAKLKYMWALYGLLILSLTGCIMWVRNTYGYLWCLFYLLPFGVLLYYHSLPGVKFFLGFHIAALFTENLWASIVLLKIAWKNPKQAGDAYALKQYTLIPTLIWALFFLLVSGVVLVLSLFYSHGLRF